MKKLFDKNEVTFAIIIIVIYVVGSTVMNQFSEMIGIEFLAEAVFGIVLFAVLSVFISKNRLGYHLGLCKPEVPAGKMLLYIPLLLTASVGIIFGFAPQYDSPAIVIHSVYMLFTGYLEEMIFRGFLFRGMAKKNMTSAIIVSAVTFGIGHIVNLFNGYDIVSNLLQIAYAITVGFLLVFIFIRTGSLVPCIVFHSLNNVLAGFGSAQLLNDIAGSEQGGQLLNVSIRIAVAGLYLLYVLKFTPKKVELKD
ncbi:MAG: CPBP family intramembrane metalloprotease [Ruminiclostridium sp.]|nr:CPBP family intramembrane metalloprotease [Ruminiclostridium sp.]